MLSNGSDFGLEIHDEGKGWKEYRGLMEMNGCDVPILLRLSEKHSRRLLVTYNGAIQRSKAPDGVVFQRSSWLDEFECSVLQFSDPTMRKHDRLQIGWAQYSKDKWAIDSMHEVLTVLRARFELASAEATLHFGTSAGGFQACCMAALDRGSSALVNNPQFDWSRYVPTFVRALMRDVFDGEEIDSLKTREPWRVNVLKFFEHIGHTPQIHLMTNVASQGDFDNQLIPFLEGLSELGTSVKRPHIQIDPYADPDLGHNPLPKSYTIKQINSFFQS